MAVENIDIGGPAMIRAAAKNHEHVTVVSGGCRRGGCRRGEMAVEACTERPPACVFVLIRRPGGLYAAPLSSAGLATLYMQVVDPSDYTTLLDQLQGGPCQKLYSVRFAVCSHHRWWTRPTTPPCWSS